MKKIITTIVCSLLMVIVGCSTEQTPTEMSSVPSDSHSKDQPENVGATVIRYEDGWAINFYDVRRGLQVVIGVDINEYCAGVWNPDIVNIMEVTNPVDQVIVNQLIHGSNLQCWVYPLNNGFNCEEFMAGEPLASGLVDMVSTDNDLYAYFENNDNNRVNSYKVSSQGALYTPEGQRVMFSSMFKVVWPGYPDFDQVRTLVSSIVLAYN